MAEPENGGMTPIQPKQKKELPMELRLLVAFLLMGVVMFVTPYFYKATAPPPSAKPSAPAAPASAPAQQSAAPAAEPAPASDIPAPAPVAAQKEDLFLVDTDWYRISFSNRGAVVTSWLLKAHRDTNGKPLELVNTAAKVDRPFAFYFRDRKPGTDLNQALFAASPDPDGLGVTYQFSDGKVLAKKTFRFQKRGYLAKVSSLVTENGKFIPAWLAWRGGFGDLAVANPAAAQQTAHYDVSSGKLVKQAAKAAKDGPVSASGNFAFAGIEDTYFAVAFLPEDTTAVDAITFSDSVRTAADQNEVPFAGTAVSDGATNHFAVYVGPKDLDTLRAVNPRLEDIVDFGWFAFLAKPLFLVVHWTTEHYIHNYGWAIIAITIVLNFLLFPLKISSMKSMKKMQALQPQIAAINDKFKGIGMRDPRKADQNQEVMELYKKYGVNPMGGCVPMVLQIPFFIAFYKVFTVSVAMRGTSWLWVTDLSQPEHLAIKVLPLAMIASQFVMQKMTPNTSTDPNQQRMMMIMPLVFGFMFYNFSSGLVLYYLTSNLVGIAQ